MRTQALLASLVLLLLNGGCASVRPDAVANVPCCARVDELDYRTLSPSQPLRVTLGADAPRVAWADGTSPVAAFRLPATPRPLLVEVSSHVVSGPGLLEKIYVSPLTHREASAFAPVLRVLDAQYRERRSLAIEGPTKDCVAFNLVGDDRVATLVLPVSESADEAAYLVIATNDALRARSGDRLCGQTTGYTPLRWGDLADLRLRLRTLPDGTGPVRLESIVDWRAGRRRPSLFEAMAADLHDSRTGWLVLDDHQLLYVDDNDTSRARLALPLEHVARASTNADGSLAVAALDTTGQRLEWHAFQFSRERRWREAVATDFSQALDGLIRADQFVQPVGLSVPRWSTEVGFEVRSAPPKPLSGPAKEIADTAMAAGVVTALPCGVCQAGVCGPELLGPCAAAFAVGAVVGGAWATGRELLRGNLRPERTDPASQPPTDAREPARSQLAGSGRFDADTLGACLMRSSDPAEPPSWHSQGVRAPLRLLHEDATAGAVEAMAVVRLDGLTLIAETSDASGVPTASASATLVARGAVLWREGDVEAKQLTSLRWRSAARTLAEWAAITPQTLAADLDEACTTLARAALNAAEQEWRSRH